MFEIKVAFSQNDIHDENSLKLTWIAYPVYLLSILFNIDLVRKFFRKTQPTNSFPMEKTKKMGDWIKLYNYTF